MAKRSLGEQILESVKEIRAYKRGEKVRGVRTYTIDKEQRPDPYAPAAIRARFHLSQSEFAETLGINVRTLQQWEQGKRKPTGPALTLLRVVADHPEVFGIECPKTPHSRGAAD